MVNPTKLDNIMDVIGNFDLDVAGFESGYPRSGKGDPKMQARAVELTPVPGETMSLSDMDQRLGELEREFKALFQTSKEEAGIWGVPAPSSGSRRR